MRTSAPQLDLAKLINEVQAERIRLAKVEAQLKSAKERAKIARRRRKEAKQAARKAKKQVKQVKQEVADVKRALTAAEKRLAAEQRRRARPTRAAVTKRPAGTGVKAPSRTKPALARRSPPHKPRLSDSGSAPIGDIAAPGQPDSTSEPRDLGTFEPATSPSPDETIV